MEGGRIPVTQVMKDKLKGKSKNDSNDQMEETETVEEYENEWYQARKATIPNANDLAAPPPSLRQTAPAVDSMHNNNTNDIITINVPVQEEGEEEERKLTTSEKKASLRRSRKE